ncbi:MAG: DUF3592 domain-containing protein [Chloroflexi bacterium]|nr:DUF3592 domain-containing protein [Chloroflexota bacterium]
MLSSEAPYDRGHRPSDRAGPGLHHRPGDRARLRRLRPLLRLDGAARPARRSAHLADGAGQPALARCHRHGPHRRCPHRRAGRRRSYIPAVTYQYQVGEQARTGTRLDFVSWGYHRWLRDEAEKALRSYPPGATVPVYVDPERPDAATLERRLPRGQVGGCLITAVLVGVGAGLLAIGWTGLVDLGRSLGGS